MKNNFKFYGNTDFDNALCCPFCGSACLHQSLITVYDRMEGEYTLVTETNIGKTITAMKKSVDCKNSSWRRDGLIIEFWCEGCGPGGSEFERLEGNPKLLIYQHKGYTFIEWAED